MTTRSPDTNPIQKERILVVDDSEAIASLLVEDILPLAGYSARSALDSHAALDLVLDYQPDLILCDLEMPGMNGLDLLRTLEDKGIVIPSILMTAFGSEAIAAQALRMGVKAYIIKPFTTDEIISAIESALAEKRLRSRVSEIEAELTRSRRFILQALHSVGSQLDWNSIANFVSAATGSEMVIIAAVDKESDTLTTIGSTDTSASLKLSIPSKELERLAGRRDVSIFKLANGKRIYTAVCRSIELDARGLLLASETNIGASSVDLSLLRSCALLIGSNLDQS
ncbi:MAG: response regulator [Chloroflexota bacterium]